MTMPSTGIDIAVAPATQELRSQATELARDLGLPLSDPADLSCQLLLVYTAERLELRQTGPNSPGPVYVDFLTGKADYRHRYGSSKDEGLIRAVASKRNRTPTVLDATAGLGRDAFVLATHGCRVTMMERRPVIAALQADGLQRAARNKDMAHMAERIRLLPGDSLAMMGKLPGAERPEVIYLDPMYPHRSKSAMVKKEMLVLRMLAGDDDDSEALLDISLKTASRRVVVKRPVSAAPLNDHKPDLVCRTGNNRFDVYLVSLPEK